VLGCLQNSQQIIKWLKLNNSVNGITFQTQSQSVDRDIISCQKCGEWLDRQDICGKSGG